MYGGDSRIRKADFRKPLWDYSWVGSYFITICTRNFRHYFGHVENGQMVLSEIGRMVEEEWLKTPIIRPTMNLLLGPFVVMPNHFHCILTINPNPYNIPGRRVMPRMTQSQSRTPNQFGNQSKNIPAVIGGFKCAVTSQARKIDPGFAWHRRFHDHVIRDEGAWRRISEYIIDNPRNWRGDGFGISDTGTVSVQPR